MSRFRIFTIEDFSGLAGCGWQLVKGDKSFEPINLLDFVSNPMVDQIVELEIEEKADLASVCQVGPIVEIICSK